MCMTVVRLEDIKLRCMQTDVLICAQHAVCIHLSLSVSPRKCLNYMMLSHSHIFPTLPSPQNNREAPCSVPPT